MENGRARAVGEGGRETSLRFATLIHKHKVIRPGQGGKRSAGPCVCCLSTISVQDLASCSSPNFRIAAGSKVRFVHTVSAPFVRCVDPEAVHTGACSVERLMDDEDKDPPFLLALGQAHDEGNEPSAVVAAKQKPPPVVRAWSVAPQQRSLPPRAAQIKPYVLTSAFEVPSMERASTSGLSMSKWRSMQASRNQRFESRLEQLRRRRRLSTSSVVWRGGGASKVAWSKADLPSSSKRSSHVSPLIDGTGAVTGLGRVSQQTAWIVARSAATASSAGCTRGCLGCARCKVAQLVAATAARKMLKVVGDSASRKLASGNSIDDHEQSRPQQAGNQNTNRRRMLSPSRSAPILMRRQQSPQPSRSRLDLLQQQRGTQTQGVSPQTNGLNEPTSLRPPTRMHSVAEIRSWEAQTGKKWASLSLADREIANEEIRGKKHTSADREDIIQMGPVTPGTPSPSTSPLQTPVPAHTTNSLDPSCDAWQYSDPAQPMSAHAWIEQTLMREQQARERVRARVQSTQRAPLANEAAVAQEPPFRISPPYRAAPQHRGAPMLMPNRTRQPIRAITIMVDGVPKRSAPHHAPET